MWLVTCDTRDMWHMVESEYSLKIAAPQLLRFGIDSVLKIFPQRLTQWIIKLIN